MITLLDFPPLSCSDGTTIYITRDIGAAKERYAKYKFDKMIYVVASQQNLHLAQFFKVLELMGYDWAKDGRLEHINFGMVQGMSTRKGTVKFLNDILEEASSTMMEQMQKNEQKFAQIEDPERCADILGMSAVKIQDMSAKRFVLFSVHPLYLGRESRWSGDGCESIPGHSTDRCAFSSLLQASQLRL